ncbi:Cullin-4A [Grifola frondosa]|uniref:Cullin-4A n=1 Tax=Grifola frondosa TaxID=5627 RepID=A0A1C7M7F8_GRIFR|nr:Cullin-4A [Grifola frondosa]
MVDADKLEDLARMYRLFTMVPTGLLCLKKALRETIVRRGKDINAAGIGADGADLIEDLEADVAAKGRGKGKARASNIGAHTLSAALKWVQDVLDLKDKFDCIWSKAFEGDRDLESGMNEAFETFINLNEKSPEFISLFIDENLRKGLKGKSDMEVDIVLDKTITVFRYITDKDVFERYYKGHLAKRLLLGRSVSDDAERGMLAKLKVECGYQFTQKLEGMFHDMKISTDTMQAYHEHLAKTTVLILKSQARKHDLNVSTFAVVILLLFEDVTEDEVLTYEEIKAATSIPDVELQRQLQSLACAKYKILKKHPHGRDVNPEDSFSFNADFSAPLQKIKIGTVASRVENPDERKDTKDHIDEERKHQTEACIVRIMKDRKHMTHNDLINEVTRQLASRFQPNPLAIKKRIEGLIEREYLERCEDRKSYNYLA